jgi:hypothetical protein
MNRRAIVAIIGFHSFWLTGCIPNFILMKSFSYVASILLCRHVNISNYRKSPCTRRICTLQENTERILRLKNKCENISSNIIHRGRVKASCIQAGINIYEELGHQSVHEMQTIMIDSVRCVPRVRNISRH